MNIFFLKWWKNKKFLNKQKIFFVEFYFREKTTQQKYFLFFLDVNIQ